MKIRTIIAAMAFCTLTVVSGCRSTSRYQTTPVVTTTPGCCNGQTSVPPTGVPPTAAPAPNGPLPPPLVQ